MQNKNGFSTKLLLVLKEKNLTQKELSKLIDIQEAVISRWVKGKTVPANRSLTKLIKKLNLPLDYFEDTNNFYHNINNSNIGNNNTIANNDARIELLEEKIKRLELEIELLKRGKKWVHFLKSFNICL